MPSRRSFLKFMGGATAIAVVAPSLLLPKPRAVVSPDATIFLPPPGGWRPQDMQSLPPPVDDYQRGPGRMITLQGEFEPNLLATLWRHDSDGNRYVLGQRLIVPMTGSDTVVFDGVPSSARGLEVTFARLADNSPEFSKSYTFSDDWRGDFTQHVHMGHTPLVHPMQSIERLVAAPMLIR